MNTIYLLSSCGDLTVEKFHFCTWDVRDENTFVEVGICINNTGNTPGNIDYYLALPFLSEQTTAESLHMNLANSSNYRFIFNEIAEQIVPIGGDPRSGSIVTIGNGVNEVDKKYAVVPATCDILNNQKMVKLSIRKPGGVFGHIYTRILIKTNSMTIAETIKSITKRTYVFDIKVNEARNIPDDVYDYKREHNLTLLKIQNTFCLHCVPGDYEIGFSDAAKLKNIRKLEKDAFCKYLPFLKKLRGGYSIIFLKESNVNGNSFFTTFSKEYIGNKQLLIALVTNLICNLLFAIASYRSTKGVGEFWYKNMPIEWYISLAVIIVCILFCIPKIPFISNLCYDIKNRRLQNA